LAALCCITKILYVDLLAQGGPHGEVSRSGKKFLLGRLVVRGTTSLGLLSLPLAPTNALCV